MPFHDADGIFLARDPHAHSASLQFLVSVKKACPFWRLAPQSRSPARLLVMPLPQIWAAVSNVVFIFRDTGNSLAPPSDLSVGLSVTRVGGASLQTARQFHTTSPESGDGGGAYGASRQLIGSSVNGFTYLSPKSGARFSLCFGGLHRDLRCIMPKKNVHHSNFKLASKR
ncbi:hypothetical protein BaRGS_00018716 [Batillaria attramentaria]|uniref:Uncharacterized protein n=1 Tax=Batillaria attramentaria TaxID=370345 RepID=A0ABD0KRV9_9CAEN